jgi:2-aminoadipate transaminase
MNWHQQFSTRVSHMRRSTVRELLQLTSQPGMISLAGGLPDPALFPVEDIRQAVETVLKHKPSPALQYGETEGIADLRDWLCTRFSRPGLKIRRQNVMIVSGSQQALDLIGKVFLDPGDEVLVENPTYLAMLSAWGAHQPTFVPVPTDSEGLCVEEIRPRLSKKTKLAYTVPNFQNPQGITLSFGRRKQLAALLKEKEFPLVEDNPYGDLRFEGECFPSLQEIEAGISGNASSFDTHVIQLGTFSKILTPGLRVGWVIAAEDVIDKLTLAKQAADLHTSTFCQHVVLELVQRGVLERQIPMLREAYRRKRDAMLKSMEVHFPKEVRWTRPEGGMFMFVSLADGTDARALLMRALEQKVAFVPGEDFYLAGQGKNTLRLNFSNPSLEQIETGIERLGNVFRGL